MTGTASSTPFFKTGHELLEESTSCPIEVAKAGLVGSIGAGTASYFVGRLNGLNNPFLYQTALSKSLVVGGISAAYYSTMCSLAKYRHVDDEMNSAAGGFVAGLLAGLHTRSPVRTCAYPFFFAAICWFAEGAVQDYRTQHSLTFRERLEKRRNDGFFAKPPRDHFADRWEEIKARENQ